MRRCGLFPGELIDHRGTMSADIFDTGDGSVQAIAECWSPLTRAGFVYTTNTAPPTGSEDLTVIDHDDRYLPPICGQRVVHFATTPGN